jgi:hypothetical protein
LGHHDGYFFDDDDYNINDEQRGRGMKMAAGPDGATRIVWAFGMFLYFVYFYLLTKHIAATMTRIKTTIHHQHHLAITTSKSPRHVDSSHPTVTMTTMAGPPSITQRQPTLFTVILSP